MGNLPEIKNLVSCIALNSNTCSEALLLAGVNDISKLHVGMTRSFA